ncbi:MAG: 3-ketoacyl-ACP reductase [Provencibacterium sp.]|jgi:3-oxoacyl-[acyl-carrier protein] reductase|nr:3-ketoacyl-ACP reductase [Provencibacterium sp.]
MAKKVAVVTGSRRGIGLGIARALAEEGYQTVLSAVSAPEQAEDLIQELTGEGLAVCYIPCDISKKADRERLLDTVLAQYGRLDVLVNNAGVAPVERLDLLETTEESFERLLRINCEGTFFMAQAAANRMIALQKKGLEDYHPRMVNVASISSYTSSTSRGEYCVSKAGISMVTTLFADRLAEYGIPVFEVRPGIIMTDMTAGVAEKYQKLIDGGLTPIKRFGQPEDVANCVKAAVSGLLDFATGTVLNADGGFHIRRL